MQGTAFNRYGYLIHWTLKGGGQVELRFGLRSRWYRELTGRCVSLRGGKVEEIGKKLEARQEGWESGFVVAGNPFRKMSWLWWQINRLRLRLKLTTQSKSNIFIPCSIHLCFFCALLIPLSPLTPTPPPPPPSPLAPSEFIAPSVGGPVSETESGSV